MHLCAVNAGKHPYIILKHVARYGAQSGFGTAVQERRSRMAEYITKQQLQELEDSTAYGMNEFHRLLEEYTGIEARPYTAYQYFDNCGNYIGDSSDSELYDLLEAAYVEEQDG